MSYNSKTIKQVVEDIEFKKAYLPAIQRKFVWPRHKIESLFDSLMRNYPIGSFLFWELKSEKAREYVFYNFLTNYDSRSPYNERFKGNFLHPEITGILDGQQRLSSLYLGLQGTHKEKLKNKRHNNINAYPETSLYLNLLSLPFYKTDSSTETDRDKDFEFRFITKHDASQYIRHINGVTENCYWFKVGNILQWNEDPEMDDIFDNIIKDGDDEFTKELNQKLIENKRFIIKAFRDLHKRITQQELINYFKVTKDDLDDILKIFIRVNSGGTILSKSDLLFSTIVATWEEGRDEIETFIKDLNRTGDGFWFNNDFLMRSCLVLSDLPVLFKVNSFKSENVQLIMDNWEKIKSSLKQAVDLIHSFGFSGSSLTSQNSIIVIAYHFMQGGNNTDTNKENIRKYLLHSLLKNIYGGQGDQVIKSIRDFMRNPIEGVNNKYELISRDFRFNELLENRLPANKTLKITEEDIEDFLQYRKGSNAFFVLSLLYPNLRYNEVQFHQDHIHPDSKFSNAKLRDLNIPDDKWQVWQWMKDTIPNLQLLEGRRNESKNAKLFIEWLETQDVEKFKTDNYIPDTDLNFENFETFYEERKAIIREELLSVLELSKVLVEV